MTRKRFIKLLMSYGTSRNEAVKIAEDYNSRNVPYKTAYANESNLKPVNYSFIAEGLSKGIAAAAAAFSNLASAAKRAMENFTNGNVGAENGRKKQ